MKYSHIVFGKKERELACYEVKSVCQLFEEQVARIPKSIAINYKNENISYELLNQKSNQLARYIRKQYSIITQQELQPDVMIPISLGRGVNYIIGILGILKAGAAYVPISPEYPDSRIEFILNDSDSKLILTESCLTAKYHNLSRELKQILIDDTLFLKEETLNLEHQVRSCDLAYVIYTSGSTGNPKGVLVEHLSVVSQVKSADYFHADETDCMAFFSDVAFDSTTFEIWGALLNGARLFIPEDLFNLLSNPRLFKKVLIEQHLTIVLLTRSLFDLLYTLDKTVFKPLNFLLVGGEALTKNLIISLVRSEYKPKHLINAYGPSENNTFCSTYEVTNDSFDRLNSVPIGQPYSNRLGYVVDSYLQPMPIGVVGELCVGGPSLSRGYLHRSALTDEKFIPNPFEYLIGRGFSRIYKTGDLVKWLPEKVLEYVGRNDFQVKLRGYRIELNEIEERLLKISGIKQSAVFLKEGDNFSFLVAYYVADHPLNDQRIREYLTSDLPDYMVPSVFIYLESFPVTSNGKLDKRSLPEPKFQSEETDEYESKELIEQIIYEIWSRILNINNFGRNESFFNLSGNSIAAMMVRKELEDVFKIKINIVELFQYTTVKKLSERISQLLTPMQDEVNQNSKINEEKKSQALEDDPIAIVGMACRLPGIANAKEFWEMLVKEETVIRDFSDEELQAKKVGESLIANSAYVKRGSVFKDCFLFDANFFGYSVKDAEIMDPQQRQFLEVAWEALENSGNVPEKFDGEIGVFASQGRDYYFINNICPNIEQTPSISMFQAILGNSKDFLSTRVSFKLNLTGPSITLQSACSSSLTSIQIACDSLKAYSCDMALAGGVSLFYNYGYPYQEKMIESPDGYCRAFDAKAKGTVLTSGVGIVVLKRLSDAVAQKDTIYGVIKGGAINNDGSSKMAFTAPSVEGQSAVIEKALKNSRISPETISYIEAHGTGTVLGDPIEWMALHNVYQKYTNKKEYCVIGAVKTNIGHTDAAAGVFGLIKTVLAFNYGIIPATLNFKSLNPEIASFNNLFCVSSKSLAWENRGRIRRAGLSSFGLGGTNAHVILEEFRSKKSKQITFTPQLVPFSAKNRESLHLMSIKLQKFIETSDPEELLNISFTMQNGRAEFSKRAYFIVANKGSIKSDIIFSCLDDETYKDNTSVYFILLNSSFGTISDYYCLYQGYSNFSCAFRHCANIVMEKYGINLIEKLSNDKVGSERVNQHADLIFKFAIQYSLIRLLINFGIMPSACVVSGIGAAVISVINGIFSLEKALTILISTEEKNLVALVPSKAEKIDKKINIFDINRKKWLDDDAVQDPEIWFNMINNLDVQDYDFTPIDASKAILVNIHDDFNYNRIDASSSVEISFLSIIGKLWMHGLTIEWSKINGNCSANFPILDQVS